MPLYLIILIALSFWPQLVSATVSINEVAWMGGISSANHEWIEIYNDGEANSVEGWVLSDGMNLNITLSGTVGANTYAVLERTSDDSAPGTAFLIYTGAMVNTGATLVLRDQNGSTIDQVSGGENWSSIGGDNVTKETAQYTSSGWITAEATPGAINKTTGSVTPDSTPVNTSSGSSSGSRNKSSGNSSSASSVNLKNLETKLVLKPEVQKIAYVHQTIPFLADTSGVDDHKSKLVNYEWNFGDTYTEKGKKVTHSYDYPGQYVVTVIAKYKKEEQVSRHDVTVLPVSFSLSRSEKGDVQINNDSPYDIDLSGYKIRGAKEIIFPPRSIISSKSTITVSANRFGGTTKDMIALYDTKNNLVTSTFKAPALLAPDRQETVSQNIVAQNVVSPRAVSPSSAFNFETSVETKEVEEVAVVESAEVSPAAVSLKETAAGDSSTQNTWTYLVFILVLLGATGVVLFGRKSSEIDQP